MRTRNQIMIKVFHFMRALLSIISDNFQLTKSIKDKKKKKAFSFQFICPNNTFNQVFL